MGQLGFYFDMTTCVGCKTCQIACIDKNDLPLGTLFRRVEVYDFGEFPNPHFYNLVIGCNHCENPACVTACPTGAMYKTEEGPVLHDDEICDGCGRCVDICPYGQPKLIPELGVVHKCDTCISIRQNGHNPICVDSCFMRALEFGDMDELREKHKDETLVSELPTLPSAELTHPNLLIHPNDYALEENVKFKAVQ